MMLTNSPPPRRLRPSPLSGIVARAPLTDTPPVSKSSGNPEKTSVAHSISIVEDDPEVREHLTQLIDGAAGFRCVGAFADGEEALKNIAARMPDVVLMDINLPKMSGIECVTRLKALNPSVHVLMLTAFEDSEKIFQALSAGAGGYLVKRAGFGKLLEAIAELLAGGSPMSSSVARQVVQYFHRLGPAQKESEDLSPREKEILEMLVAAQLYKEISEKLGIGLETVRTHVQHIYLKLHVRTRTEAVVKYLRQR